MSGDKQGVWYGAWAAWLGYWILWWDVVGRPLRENVVLEHWIWERKSDIQVTLYTPVTPLDWILMRLFIKRFDEARKC